MLKLFRKKRFPKTGEFDAEADLKDWTIFQLKNEETGASGFLRVRRTRPTYVDTSDFEWAVSIRWKYPSSSLPDSAVNEQMYEFERAIDELSAANGYSELVQVSTGFGEREWIFYTVSREQFMARFNALLTGHAPYPLEINFYRDAKWKIWQDTLAPILARAEND